MHLLSGQILKKAGETAYQMNGSRTRLEAIEKLKLPDAPAMAASTRQAISRYEDALKASPAWLR